MYLKHLVLFFHNLALGFGIALVAIGGIGIFMPVLLTATILPGQDFTDFATLVIIGIVVWFIWYAILQALSPASWAETIAHFVGFPVGIWASGLVVCGMNYIGRSPLPGLTFLEYFSLTAIPLLVLFLVAFGLWILVWYKERQNRSS